MRESRCPIDPCSNWHGGGGYGGYRRGFGYGGLYAYAPYNTLPLVVEQRHRSVAAAALRRFFAYPPLFVGERTERGR
jgi:hypothetical protein